MNIIAQLFVLCFVCHKTAFVPACSTSIRHNRLIRFEQNVNQLYCDLLSRAETEAQHKKTLSLITRRLSVCIFTTNCRRCRRPRSFVYTKTRCMNCVAHIRTALSSVRIRTIRPITSSPKQTPRSAVLTERRRIACTFIPVRSQAIHVRLPQSDISLTPTQRLRI